MHLSKVVIILILSVFFGIVHGGKEEFNWKNVKELDCEVNQTYSASVSQSKPALFNYEIDFGNATEMEMLDTHLEVEISVSTNTSWEGPLLIAIHQSTQILNIKLPWSFDDKPSNESVWYYSVKKTLCLSYPTKAFHNENIVAILITAYTTVRTTPIDFNLKVSQAKGLYIGVGESREFTVSPLETTYRRFDFVASNVDMIEILVKSEGKGEDVCTVLASHDPYCPVYDQQENVEKTSFKKFTRAAVTREWRGQKFPKGFTIVIVPQANDYECTWNESSLQQIKSKDEAGFREKHIKLTIREVKQPSIIWMAIFPVVTLLIPCFIVALLLFFLFNRRFKNEFLTAIRSSSVDRESQDNVDNGNPRKMSADEMLEGAQRVPQLEPVLDEEDHVTYEKITETYEYIAGRKARYCTVTCVVSIYYIIPAFQLLIYHVGGMRKAGNYDQCYYNELCRIRWHAIGLSDFNHVLSNGLYVAFGIIFLCFVAWRKRTLEALKEKNKHTEIMRGVQIPYGAYYAMGISLIMEGFLSSAYHLCPSGSTFQFDVAFMNIIAVIVISTLHQLRYRVVPSGAKTFVFLSLLILISAIFFASENYWWEMATLSLVLRIIFVTLHIVGAFVYCTGLYYFGNLRDQDGAKISDFRRVLKLIFIPTCMPNCCGLPEGLPMSKILQTKIADHGMKLFSVILLFVANAGATILLAMTNDFAHHLLFVLIMNTMLSFIMYINWKIYHKEYSALMIQPMLYIVLAGLFGTCAIRKFKMDLTEWNAAPAQSRVLNQPCLEIYGGYFDQHDVWHFFSAVALFYSFMSLLTIDDGIMMRRRRDIKIF